MGECFYEGWPLRVCPAYLCQTQMIGHTIPTGLRKLNVAGRFTQRFPVLQTQLQQQTPMGFTVSARCTNTPSQPVLQLSRCLPQSPRTPRLQFQAARRNVCLARSSPIKGHTLPTGPPMYQATEWMDCRGAQGLIPVALNPTAWGAACRNVRGRVETFRNIGGLT